MNRMRARKIIDQQLSSTTDAVKKIDPNRIKIIMTVLKLGISAHWRKIFITAALAAIGYAGVAAGLIDKSVVDALLSMFSATATGS